VSYILSYILYSTESDSMCKLQKILHSLSVNNGDKLYHCSVVVLS